MAATKRAFADGLRRRIGASPSYTILMVTKGVMRWAVDRWVRAISAASVGRRGGRVAAFVLLCCAAAACGGTGSTAPTRPPHLSVAAHVCARARRAARPLLGTAARLRIASTDRTNIECVLDSNGVRVDAVAQASAVAWTEYDTATVHQAQAYGSGGLNQPSELPHPVPGMGGNATWIPANHELIATNGTESRGGSYLTVTVTRRSDHGPATLAVATAVGSAMLASAPRGPNPGPPPS